nr:hypothetical protein [Tanacetum cinerariifolium]
MENQSDVQNHLVEIQADNHDLLVNFDNKNDDILGYESEKYSDDKDADGTNHVEDADETNHSDLKLVERCITRLYKFRREYGKPSGIKIKVTFDALNRVSALHRALFLSFLGDLVREHIVRKLIMHHLGKRLRNFRMKLREKYILPNLNTPSKLNELPAKYSAIVKAKEWVEFVNYMTTDAYKKEVNDKIKEGTLNLSYGTDAMTIVYGKKKGGYARGVGSGVTYKRYFHLPRSRQATDERIELLQSQLDNERRERQQKDVLVKKLSTEMTEKDVTPIGTYEVDGTQSSVVVRDKDARIQKKSNGLVTSKKEPVKTIGPKKTPKFQRNESRDSQSQGNASKCKLWHLKKSNIVALGTMYKSDEKQMLHN